VSLQSDILLNSIKNLANLPANRDDILRRRTNREAVTSRLVLEGHNLDIVTFPARDSRGLTRLDYAVRLRSPSDLSMAEEKTDAFPTLWRFASAFSAPRTSSSSRNKNHSRIL